MNAALRLEEVHRRIAHACKIARREPAEVTLIAVSKTHPAEAIAPLLEAGHRTFGENRVQEAMAKWPALRERWPDAAERRRALDAALEQGGPLDPFVEHGATAVTNWLREGQREGAAETTRIELVINTPTPDGLTLRQLQLLGAADAILHEPGIPAPILDRARADAPRLTLPHNGPLPGGLVVVLRRG